MKAIIEAIPEFEARCNIQRYGKVIEVMAGDGAGSIYESLSADDKRAHGLGPSFWVFDEYAQAAEFRPARQFAHGHGEAVGKSRHHHQHAGGK
jgi:phage terminase large subunit-like protein